MRWLLVKKMTDRGASATISRNARQTRSESQKEMEHTSWRCLGVCWEGTLLLGTRKKSFHVLYIVPESEIQITLGPDLERNEPT
jgi:hypothetical protein